MGGRAGAEYLWARNQGLVALSSSSRKPSATSTVCSLPAVVIIYAAISTWLVERGFTRLLRWT